MLDPRVDGCEAVEAVVGRWSPDDLAYIERLELDLSGDAGSTLTLTTLFQRKDRSPWPAPSAGFHRVRLRFDDLRSLRLRDYGAAPQQVIGFQITDVADRGWEAMRYEVSSYEGDTLAFYCRAITVLDVDPAAIDRARAAGPRSSPV